MRWSIGIALTDLAVLSERRWRDLDPAASYGLPANLAGGAVGLNTGFAQVQANAVALVGEMRLLAAPASIGSIPAKGNQEDHNSMAMGAVRKTIQIIGHLEGAGDRIAVRGPGDRFDQRKMSGFAMGNGTALVYELIQRHVPPMWEDAYVEAEMDKMIRLGGGKPFCAK